MSASNSSLKRESCKTRDCDLWPDRCASQKKICHCDHISPKIDDCTREIMDYSAGASRIFISKESNFLKRYKMKNTAFE